MDINSRRQYSSDHCGKDLLETSQTMNLICEVKGSGTVCGTNREPSKQASNS